jgi:hypothetical protein
MLHVIWYIEPLSGEAIGLLQVCYNVINVICCDIVFYVVICCYMLLYVVICYIVLLIVIYC